MDQQPGVTVKHDYVPNQSNFKNEMRAFAQQGYDIVICHGSEYVKAAREVAPARHAECRRRVRGELDGNG